MHCHACGNENRADVRFCEQCGTLLKGSNTRICPACGHKNAGSAQFCEQCGDTLAANDKKRRVWLWGLLGMLLALVLCCFSFLLLPQPPPEEQTFLPSVVDAGWQMVVQRREMGLQSSGLSGSLLRAGSAIIPQPVSQAVGDLIRQAAGGEKEELQDDEKKDEEPILDAAVQCTPNIQDKTQCEASGGVLWDWLGEQFCHCPGGDENGRPAWDKEWCLAEGGSWNEPNSNCSFYNQCHSTPGFYGKHKDGVCHELDGYVDTICRPDQVNSQGVEACYCLCPNPEFSSQACKEKADSVKLINGPVCSQGEFLAECYIDMATTDKLFNDPNGLDEVNGAVFRWPDNQSHYFRKCSSQPGGNTVRCEGVFKPNLIPPGNVQATWCWGGCCYDLGELEVQPENDVIRNLAASTAQTCCQNVRARNVKYFRDPPGIGDLFLGFDMQCTDANWQLGSQCASFDALVGASRTIHWTSGECCPDPNYPDRLNCSGSIEGQKKSMTKIVMTYGSCTAEAEFQSPYQAPVEQSDSTSKPKPPSDSSPTTCPSGKSMCAGVCCSNCQFDGTEGKYYCAD